MAGKKAEKEVGNFKPVTTDLPDGTYTGHYKAFGAIDAACVEFAIEDRKVKTFSLNKVLETPGHSGSELIINEIDRSKNLDFDAVSGATRTSFFIKAGIKDALSTAN
jgi:uncharacterized protein with FMN-binding domain